MTTDDDDDDDVSFKYLKHVLIKFLTSREYEVQLILHFFVMNILYSHKLP
jgi:hypothetical protein